MNQKDRETALEINAMLMAFYNDDFKTMQSILSDAENPVDLLLGGLSVTMGMIDELISFISEQVDEIDIDFESLIQVRGQYLADLESDD